VIDVVVELKEPAVGSGHSVREPRTESTSVDLSVRSVVEPDARHRAHSLLR
jgi:hypothetical protein